MHDMIINTISIIPAAIEKVNLLIFIVLDYYWLLVTGYWLLVTGYWLLVLVLVLVAGLHLSLGWQNLLLYKY